MKYPTTDRVAIITGATGGIGQACARKLSTQGVRLVLVDLNIDQLHALAREMSGESLCIAADVADQQQTSRYVEASVARFGRVDIAMLNAGIEGQTATIEAASVEAFDSVMRVNVRGVWLALASLMPVMRLQNAGSIVITSSITGLRGTIGQGAYVASKHAVIGLTKVAALEGASQGIRVNAVCPGPVETRMMGAIELAFNPEHPEEARAKIVAGVAQKRYGLPDEVANVMCFLAGPEATFCTGAVFSVDGGAMAGPVR